MRTLVFLFSMAAAAADTIPRHPRELKFPEVSYTPPRAADFRHKLASGAVAFLVEDHDFPLVNISVLVRTGEYLEPAGKTGLSEITGSQLRAGGSKSMPPAKFDEEAAFLAATIASRIGPLDGNATLNCLSKDVDAGLALFVEMLKNPGFAEDRLKLAKTQMLQGLERRNDRADAIERREYERLLRGDRHFSTQPVTKASLEAITRDDLIGFHQKYFYPANFVLAVSGDFKTPEMLARLEKAFSNWPNPGGAVPPVPEPDFTPKPGIYVVDKKDVNQGRVRMGHLGVKISNPDHLTISVMNGILGGAGFTSRITTRIRSEEGLAYQAGSEFRHGNFYPGAFSVVLQSRSPTVAQAITIVKQEIARMREGTVTAEELETEKNYIIGTFPRRFATASLQASQFAMDYYLKMPDDYWIKYRDRIRAITVEDIQRVARKYLQPENLVILAVGDWAAMEKGNPDRAQFSFTSLGPVTQIPLPDPLTMIYPANASPAGASNK